MSRVLEERTEGKVCSNLFFFHQRKIVHIYSFLSNLFMVVFSLNERRVSLMSEPHVDIDPVEVGVLIRYGVFVFVILPSELVITFCCRSQFDVLFIRSMNNKNISRFSISK
jgi:hypothetical protein